MSFFFENKKWCDNTQIVLSKEILAASKTIFGKQYVKHRPCNALIAAHGSLQKSFQSLSEEGEGVINTGSFISDGSEVEVHGISMDGLQYSVLPGTNQRRTFEVEPTSYVFNLWR